MKVTVDASVWLAALSSAEPSHESCAEFINYVAQQSTAMHQPVLFIVELSAAIARRSRDASLAMQASEVALTDPNLVLHELNHELAATATHIAAVCALRGADSVYAATARTVGATLITLDREVLTRGVTMADIQTPSQWMLLQRE